MRLKVRAAAAVYSALAFLAFAAFAAPASSAPESITLITGDRVTLGSGGVTVAQVQPRKGRETLRFLTEVESRTGEQSRQIFVIPEDALTLISAGQLDRELFNVTALADLGKDGGVPMVVTYTAQTRSLSAAGATLAGASVTSQLSSINGLALRTSQQEAGRFWDTLTGGRAAAASKAAAPLTLNGTIRKVWLDRRFQPVLDRSVPQIGAPAAWNAGYQGDGVVVAVIDTGVDLTHPDLAGKVIAHQNFTTEEDKDIVGHGTHVASTIAGTGAASGGKYRGVAPGALLVSGKVCVVSGCLLSDIIEGMQWAVAEQGAKIVNLSLGGPDSPGIDPLEEAVNVLTAEYGALFVIAAGNSARPGTVSSPSTADAALSVAAVDRTEQIAFFSSRGPRVDGAIKPEIAAPGVGIVAALANGSDIGAPIEDFYVALDGTSMATPHVAGAAALLSQLHPEWGPHQLKAVLIGSAKRSPTHATYDVGAGRVDVETAFATTLTAEPSTVAFGTVQFPHDDDVPITRTVTYRNEGSTPLTLVFRTVGVGPTGAPAPVGMFTFSPASLTISPGETGTAQITVDTRGNTPDGIYGGALIADVNGKTFTVPVAVNRESESYDVRVTHTGSNGLPVLFYLASFLPLDRAEFSLRLPNVPGEAVIRLPAGRYALESNVFEVDQNVLFHQSELVVNAARSITLDARNATRLQVTPPKAGATQFWTELARLQTTPFISSLAFTYSQREIRFATQNLDGPSENFTSFLNAAWRVADANGKTSVYSAGWVSRGQLVAGPTLSMPPEKLSTVKATYDSAFSNVTSGFAGAGMLIPEAAFVIVPGTPLTVPHKQTEFYYSSDDTVRWTTLLDVALERDGAARFESTPTQFLPARRYEASWNQPTFAPVFPAGAASQNYAIRIRDTLNFLIPMFGDRSGHVGFIGPTQLELFANGQKIAEAASSLGRPVGIAVPAERATYRLQASGAQSSFGLSTRVTAAWTFASERSETGATPLPLLSLQFEPRLNERGQAFRGLPYAIPITARQLTQPGAVHLGALTVEASFDDGVSWKRVAVKREGKQWVAILLHPRNAEYVSLRAVASDSSGNSVEETVIRAYGLIDVPRPH